MSRLVELLTNLATGRRPPLSRHSRSADQTQTDLKSSGPHKPGPSVSHSQSVGVSSIRRLNGVCLLMLGAALLALLGADIHIYAVDPWRELGRIGLGLVQPHWDDLPGLLQALGNNLAFAFIAVALAAPLGLLLAMLFHWRGVRIFCASVRSVHELFWGLIFMQIYGLSATTGLLAILVPFTGVFAKVFAEIFEQQSATPRQTLPPALRSAKGALKRYAYTLIPQAWPSLVSYTRYRMCAALQRWVLSACRPWVFIWKRLLSRASTRRRGCCSGCSCC